MCSVLYIISFSLFSHFSLFFLFIHTPSVSIIDTRRCENPSRPLRGLQYIIVVGWMLLFAYLYFSAGVDGEWILLFTGLLFYLY